MYFLFLLHLKQFTKFRAVELSNVVNLSKKPTNQKKANVHSMSFAKSHLSIYAAALAMGFITCRSYLRFLLNSG